MRYYDDAVDTSDKREAMCHAVKTRYMGRTFYPRQRVILRECAKSIQDKLVLEIGCGTSRTIARLLPPKHHGYRYIGVDISFYRLVVAKRLLPEADFVQGSALDLPFQEGIADMGLALGALHHLPRPIETLRRLDRVLKDTAFLAVHEPIHTPKLIEGKLPFLERLFTTYQHSSHDGAICTKELMTFLADYNFSEVRAQFSITPFRTLAETCIRLMSSESVLESKHLANVLYPADAVLVNTIGRFSSLLGPRAVTVMARRWSRNSSASVAS